MSQPPNLTPIEKLWSIEDVMDFLGMKRTFVYSACATRGLPHLRLGNRYKFEPDQVRAWVAKNRGGPPANVVPIAGGRR